MSRLAFTQKLIEDLAKDHMMQRNESQDNRQNKNKKRNQEVAGHREKKIAMYVKTGMVTGVEGGVGQCVEYASQESVNEEVFLPDISRHGRMHNIILAFISKKKEEDKRKGKFEKSYNSVILTCVLMMTMMLRARRNLFDYVQDIQQSVKELHQKLDREKKFRIEDGVKKGLGVFAKAAFGTDIFKVSDCFIEEIKQLIQLEMSRTPTALEIRLAKQYISGKFSMEYRPAMYRTCVCDLLSFLKSQESVNEEVFLPDISRHGRMDLEDIIPDTPEFTLRLNTGRNLFDYVQDIQQSVKELHQKLDREKKFRIEDGVKKGLGVFAKAAFGTDIFKVSDCFIEEIKQLIQLEMSRTPTALEIRLAKQYISGKFSMEYRPAMYRTVSCTQKTQVYTAMSCQSQTMEANKLFQTLFRAFHNQERSNKDHPLPSIFDHKIFKTTNSQESVNEEVFLPDISRHERMDLEDIIPDTPESTLRLNTGRNLFDYVQDIQQSVKELHQKLDREKKFRIEDGVKKGLGVFSKAAFGTDIFKVSDCFIEEIKQLIQLEMSRTPTALEIRLAKQYISGKFSMEYRPAMYRTVRYILNKGCLYTLA
ncbi:unnamed protein product [Mytilus coruscus]|uniref:Uncharacterized protein n=1 Tax=Mytilus coruscus TaxID=42192 RepID=A0A6J8DRY8_MYTCO|nr:unnamed protein product [Mytilus coruscus]